MISENEVRQSLSVMNGKLIQELTKTLSKYTPISYFAHTRTYKAGYASVLTCEPEILIEACNTQVYKKARYAKLPGIVPNGNYLWISDTEKLSNDEKISREFFYKHDIGNGLTIVRNSKDICDFYTFAGHLDEADLNNFYINNIALLDKFISYYHIQCNRLLRLLDSKTRRDGLVLLKGDDEDESQYPSKYGSEEMSKVLHRVLSSTDFCNMPFTKRQIDVAKHLITGKTNKEIGEQLGLSARTVENYISAMRLRLGTNNKFELIVNLIQNYNKIFES